MWDKLSFGGVSNIPPVVKIIQLFISNLGPPVSLDQGDDSQ